MAASANSRGRPTGSFRLVSQARNIVYNVVTYFDKEKSELIEVPLKKTAEATKVSLPLVRKIRLEARKSDGEKIKSPIQHPRIQPVLGNIDDFDKEAIRGEILGFYKKGELSTLDLLLPKVKEPPINFAGSRTSLWTLIQEYGISIQETITATELY